MKITLVRGDITEQSVDAVVNAAKPSLLGGSGVDGAIHRRGGAAILDECRALRASRFREGLPTGQAVSTTAGELPARWVIHTVGPRHSDDDRSALLASCYRECLRVADEVGAASVAFPAVSAGAYGWPMADAARIAVQAVHSADTNVADVRFVLFSDNAYAAFDDALKAAGPTDEEIAADLAAQPAERWQALFARADALTDADLEVRWGGGHQVEPGVTHMPYPIYSDAVHEVLALLSGLHTVVVFDWMRWVRVNPLPAEGLGAAPVAVAVRITTSIIRGERFSEGTIEQAIDNGMLRAIIDRLRRWFDSERVDSAHG
jgi:O-acetyl-ADP-ribose deacetylase (regulator of RNase III)